MSRCALVRLAAALALLATLLIGPSLAAQRPTSLSQSQQLRDVYAPVVAAARQSVVEVAIGDRVRCLGTAVAPEFVVTKHSELVGRTAGDAAPWSCRSGERRWPCELVGHDQPTDLALLRVTGPPLTPVDWATATPSAGAFLATPGTNAAPLGIGILSTAPYVHTRPRAFLGVRFADSGRNAAALEEVVEHGAARAAGLLAKDVVVGLDGAAIATAQALRDRLARLRPGDRVQVKVKRGDEELSFEVTLGSDTSAPRPTQAGLWGPLSDVSSGFAVVLQHDTVLLPEHCGGPLVDLSGKVVGVNIARAGRVETLALPALTVQRTFERLRGAPTAK